MMRKVPVASFVTRELRLARLDRFRSKEVAPGVVEVRLPYLVAGALTPADTSARRAPMFERATETLNAAGYEAELLGETIRVTERARA